jgi:hypothetical protein
MTPLLDQLRQLEAELHHPGAGGTRERLEQLLHPDFHEVGRSGRVYNRDTVINYLASARPVPEVEPSGHELRLLAEGCALLTYRSARRGPDGAWTEAALRSSVWMRTAQGWQLFYHQGTPSAPD